MGETPVLRGRGRTRHFLQEQTLQAIENIDDLSIIGQNNPNFGHSLPLATPHDPFLYHQKR